MTKKAIVIGATSGIGAATAKKFAKLGANVALIGRNQQRGVQLENELKQHGVNVSFIACDVSNLKQVETMVAQVGKSFGRVDVLFNNAGVMLPSMEIERMPVETWQETFNININGIFYVKLRIPSMIVTTGLALIYESLANYMAGGVEQTLPAHLRAFGRMPWDIILALVACVVAYIFLNYTKIGTYTYAIGSDEFVAKNMGINVNKYKVLAFILSGAFLGVMAILTISYGSSMVAVTGMASMSRNFVPTMGCFFGLAFKKYGMPLQAIIIGEFVINIIFFGFIALGAPTAIQDVITGFALLIIVTLTTKVTKGEIVK